MKIFFSATTYKFNELGDHYFMIRDHLIKSGNVIVHDWLSKIKKKGETYDIPQAIASSEYRNAIEAVENADLVIFETTQPSFSSGHLMTLALQKKTPTLMMWLDDSPWSIRRGMIENIDSNYLELAEYNSENYAQILDSFINKYGNAELKHRFNLVIDDVERQYLDWLSYNTLKSRTALIRKMIRESVERDEEYKRFLGRV